MAGLPNVNSRTTRYCIFVPLLLFQTTAPINRMGCKCVETSPFFLLNGTFVDIRLNSECGQLFWCLIASLMNNSYKSSAEMRAWTKMRALPLFIWFLLRLKIAGPCDSRRRSASQKSVNQNNFQDRILNHFQVRDTHTPPKIKSSVEH